MPRKSGNWTVQEPDMLDVHAVVASIGEEFNLRVQFHCEYVPDAFQVIARAYSLSTVGPGVLQFQALSKKPLQRANNCVAQMFTTAWDIYCQASGGGATAAERGVPAGWNGRPAKRG